MLKKFMIFAFCCSLLGTLNCQEDEILFEDGKNGYGVEEVIEVGPVVEQVVQKEGAGKLDENSDLEEDILDDIEESSEEIIPEISDEDLDLITDDRIAWKDKLNIALKYIKVTSIRGWDRHSEKIIAGIIVAVIVAGGIYWHLKS